MKAIITITDVKDGVIVQLDFEPNDAGPVEKSSPALELATEFFAFMNAQALQVRKEG